LEDRSRVYSDISSISAQGEMASPPSSQLRLPRILDKSSGRERLFVE
jgi:hypothetical protein